MEEELRFHLEMEMEKNLRAGMNPEEARRQAGIAFGGLDKHKEQVRDARGLGWIPGLSLDLKLGARMLAKHPGLTLVGGLGMAVAIAISAVFDVTAAVVHTPLPLDDGERLVAIESWDAEINNQERQILHDFTTWREELRAVEDLGAYRDVARNLIVPGGSVEPISVAEMTASGFRAARVPPLLGRPLLQEDERPGAPQVVVIGYAVWQNQFRGDPNVVGRQARLGNTVHTVVGVMPEGFAFPINHRLWTPLRADPAAYERRNGPGIQVFGRLAPGATLEQAQAELTAIGKRTAAAYPETHAQLRSRVLPYGAHFFDDMQGWEISATRLLLTLLLVVICVNVAALVYARTATRMGEISLRSALGASRRRIVAQLFAEALVLAGAAALVGLVIAGLVLRQLDALAEQTGAQMGGLPFWIDLRLSLSTVLYVVGLAVLAAVIVGVVPAFQATGRRLQSSLRQLGGATGMQLGRLWTVLIVAQVAFAVAVLPAAVFFAWEFTRYGFADPGFAAEDYLMVSLGMERESPPSAAEAEANQREFEAHFSDRVAELVRRLRTDPGVAGATLALTTPGHEPRIRVEVEGASMPAASASGHAVGANGVDPDFFEVFNVPVLAGRPFQTGDLGAAASSVIVNQSFAQQISGDANPVGRRIRLREGYPSGGVMRTPAGMELERWYEIVGVVGDLPSSPLVPGQTQARLYHALAPGQAYPMKLALRIRGAAPESFVPRLREITATLDPTLQLEEVIPLDQSLGRLQGGMRIGALVLGLITLSVLLLSAAGIYALMSFTVTQRRKEIGIRTALGADPRRILGGIFSRALGQLAVGALVGLAAAALLDRSTAGEITGGHGAIVLPAVVALMLTVGLLAALGPARRGLRVQPMDALREE
jgi:predicted permease